MPSEDDRKENEAARNDENLPILATEKFIRLGQNIAQIDLSGLTQEQIQELKVKHADRLIDVNVRAAELVADVQALRGSLNVMADTTNAIASQEGQSITITQTQKNVLGETEIVIGNTPTAQRGKLGRSRGDNTTLWFALAALVIIAIVIIAIVGR